MKLTLYELTTDFDKYMNAETDEEMATELAEITAGQIEVKAESYCKFVTSLDGFAAQCKAEADRIAKVAKVAANKAERIKAHMMQCMEAAGISNIPAGTFSVKIQNNPPALHAIDEGKTPCEYMVVIPESYQIDKAAVKDALKIGKEVPGWELTVGKSLRMR